MDVLVGFLVLMFFMTFYAVLTARKAERHTRLQPKMDIRRYDVGPNDFLAITLESQISDIHAQQLRSSLEWHLSRDGSKVRVVVLPPNSQLSVIRKLPGFQAFTEVRQELVAAKAAIDNLGTESEQQHARAMYEASAKAQGFANPTPWDELAPMTRENWLSIANKKEA